MKRIGSFLMFISLFATSCELVDSDSDSTPNSGTNEIKYEAVEYYLDKGIPKDHPAFKSWGTSVLNSLKGTNSSDPKFSDPNKALGKAEGTSFEVYSLGDGGYITLEFANGISNGPGADFAVFENSFNETFLELAFVYVSSDGTNFFIFYNTSTNGSEYEVDRTKISGLASKYMQGLGTLFDLEDLKKHPDYSTTDFTSILNNIRYVKIVDILSGTDKDSIGNIIYDACQPASTTTAGFDLDAIGVINQAK